MTQRIPLAVAGAVFLIAPFAAPLAAQETDGAGFRGMVRLNRAPVSNEVLKVKLPRPVEQRLANGIRLVILESKRTPSVSLTISIPRRGCARSAGHARHRGSDGRHDDDRHRRAPRARSLRPSPISARIRLLLRGRWRRRTWRRGGAAGGSDRSP
jgi:hypothetical protein